MVIFFWAFPLITTATPLSLAEWTFPENPDDNLVDVATLENSTELLSVTGTNPPTFTAEGASTSAAQATGWQSGAGSKYWHTKINTTGYKDVLVSVKLRSSNTGPKDFALQYRLATDTAWLDVPGGMFTVGNNFTTGVLELLPLPESAHDQETVFLRLLMNSLMSVSGGVVAGTGTNRIDDFIITATPTEEDEEKPEPGDQCAGSAEAAHLTEILPYPTLSDQEYAEFFNSSEQCVNMSGWRLEDAGHHTYIFPAGSVLNPGTYQVLIQNLFLNNTTADTLTLYSAENEALSRVEYGKAIKGLSYSFDGAEWRFSSHLTPGSENIFDEVEEEETALPGSGIILNEIFPNPPQNESTGEFIELKNITSEEKDLAGWSLVDASQKIFTFPAATIVAPQGFLIVPRSDFGFSLNNTGTETITLLDPQGNTLSQAQYTSTQENFSYSWDGKKWRWTKKITLGSKNEFSKVPKITITSETEGYVDTPLSFKIDIKNAKKPYKYSWDFSDGRRSTLAEPKHTFEKTGAYKASVTVRSDDGIAEKEFTVNIKKYPTYAVLITALHPNPEGIDTGKEWVEIKNFTNKKIDLTGWKLATGNDELTNHLLIPDIILAPSQTLRLTRRHAAFSLVNSSGTIELRYPNNKAASRTQYQEKEVPENSTCFNTQERCDFPDNPKKEIATSEEQNESRERGNKNIQNELALTGALGEPPALPTKKEILLRMGDNFNLLMNQLVFDATHKNSSPTLATPR